MLDPDWTPERGYGHAWGLLATSALAVLLALVLAAGASAAGQSLDQVASGIAGHSVTVDCVGDWTAWQGLLAQYRPLEPAGAEVEAFTPLPAPEIFLGPTVCPLLLQVQAGPPFPYAYLAGRALLALAHEAVHQRGVLDEGVTDCTALGLVRATALALGVPATIRQRFRVRVRHHRHRWLVRYRTLPNPWLAGAVAGAQAWHRLKPPAYQGGC